MEIPGRFLYPVPPLSCGTNPGSGPCGTPASNKISKE
jgi:hypothetical protein